MLKPRQLYAALAVFVISSLQFVASTPADQTPTASERAGVELYEKGDDVAAIQSLQATVKTDKYNLRAWHYLGLAFERQGQLGNARSGYETATKLGDRLLEGNWFRNVSKKEFLREMHGPISLAAASARRYIALSPKLSRSRQAEWNGREEYLRNFAEYSDPTRKPGQGEVFSAKEVDTRVRVLSKPEPQYTEEAREHGVRGTILLQAVLAGDGNVTFIFPIKTLPYGLTQMAIRSARLIKFDPAIKDGKPVSMVLQLEYSFNLY